MRISTSDRGSERAMSHDEAHLDVLRAADGL
jgi:hypothetical protein